MLHQAGFSNSVATLGTALTPSHLPLLKKSEAKVILAYDGDNAGINAAFKAAKLLSSNSFEGRVVLFPKGYDPADMVASNNIKKLKELLDNGTDLVIFVINYIKNLYNLNNPYEKEQAIKEIKAFLNSLSLILQESYAIEAARILNIDIAYFKPKSNIKNITTNSSFKRDLAWESILKTLLNKKELIDDILNVIDFSLAKEYKEAFEALAKGDLDHPILRGIQIDEKVPILTPSELKKQIINELLIFYKHKLKELTYDKKLDFKKKSYLIRKIKVDILPRLKNGELVEYESDFFI